MDRLTKISLDLAAVALLCEAAGKFITIERLKERFRGTKPQYLEHEGALLIVLGQMKEITGVE